MRSVTRSVSVSLLISMTFLLLSEESSGQTTTSAIRYGLILRNLAAVTSARATLESTIRNHKGQYGALGKQSQQQRASCVCYNKTVVAFTAHLDTDVSVFGVNQPLPFDRVSLNQGNAYDVRHAQFRAPFSGTYKFFVTLTANAKQPIVADFMLNGTPVIKSRTGNSYYITTAMNAIVVHMNAGDEIWVQHDHSITDSNRILHGDGYLTTFSGYLISRD